jgi:thiosulfate/3-mercaptopyruvate sulfurtransferase
VTTAPDNLVSVDWLHNHLDDHDLVVLDCTNFAEFNKATDQYKTVSGYANWARDHIAGSSFADFATDLSSNPSPFRNSLPDPETFAAAMGALGIGDESRVVLYDTGASMWAARVWWMLRWVGFDGAAVLDGGLPRWKAAGGETTSETNPPKQKTLTPNIRPELFVTKADVEKALENGSTSLIDALSEAQFTGSGSELGICGHIPGAINIPATSLIDPDSEQYYPLEKLADRFPQDRTRPVIIYCGSGIAAASNAFTMHRLGFQNISIYMPGLQEWICDADAPLINGQAAPVE